MGLGAGNRIAAPSWNVPGAPTTVTASGDDGNINVIWSAPASNGDTLITGYSVSTSPWPSPAHGLGLTCPDTGLAQNSSHTYTVKATNGFGTGSNSLTSNAATTWNVPGAPPS